MTELEECFRAEWGRLLSALIRNLGDFDLAEEALQEAFTVAAREWSQGPPRNPSAWLYGTARHKAIDTLRRRQRFEEKQPELALRLPETPEPSLDEEFSVPDERLRLIFTCCHPALSAESQVALTLRTLCGLTTEEIASSFMVPATTMGQRLARAKAKIRNAGIPYRVPAADELPDRLDQVMTVLYLVFNEGYMSSRGEALIREDLCLEAIRLARLLRSLLSEPDAEVDALLGLMLIHDARRAARIDQSGNIVLLPKQDRTLWDRAKIQEGCTLVKNALRRDREGPYAIEASIAAVHTEAARAEDTDWLQISLLYRHLYDLHPTPVVALNGAVAVSMAYGPACALPLVEALEEDLADYHLWHATHADLLRRLGRLDEAAVHYSRALALAGNEAEQRFLSTRLAQVRSE